MKNCSIDVVILANSCTPKLREITQVAIDSLHASSAKHTFSVLVMETHQDCQGRPAVFYTGANSLPVGLPFNFNAAVNQGLQYCKKDYVLVCNNDIIFGYNFFEAMLAVDGWDSCSAWNGLDVSRMADLKDKIEEGYDILHWGAWAVCFKRATLDKLGKWDESFDFYSQDDDIKFREKKLGLKHVYIGTARIDHLHKKTVMALHDKEWEQDKLTEGQNICYNIYGKTVFKGD